MTLVKLITGIQGQGRGQIDEGKGEWGRQDIERERWRGRGREREGERERERERERGERRDIDSISISSNNDTVRYGTMRRDVK